MMKRYLLGVVLAAAISGCAVVGPESTGQDADDTVLTASSLYMSASRLTTQLLVTDKITPERAARTRDKLNKYEPLILGAITKLEQRSVCVEGGTAVEVCRDRHGIAANKLQAIKSARKILATIVTDLREEM